MAKLNVNIGLSVNDKTGDTLRSAFDKINQNFTELYNATGVDVQIPTQTGNEGKFLRTDGTALSWVAITNNTTNELVNGTKTVSLGSDGLLTLPLQGKIGPGNDANSFLTFNYGDDVTLSAGDTLALNGYGHIVLTTGLIGVGPQRYSWDFGVDGTLTLPDSATLAVGSGAEIEALALVYTDFRNQLTDVFAGANYTGDGYPASFESYNLLMASADPDIQAFWIPIAKAAEDAYIALLTAEDSIGFNIDVYNAQWRFSSSRSNISNSLLIPENTTISGSDRILLRADGNANKETKIDLDAAMNQVLIGTTSRTWAFDNNGRLSLPAVGKIGNGSAEWTFSEGGTLTVPSPASPTMTLTFDAAHYVATGPKPTLTLTSAPWELMGEYVHAPDGRSDLALNSIFPTVDNPGYETGDTFAFDASVHGIVGYTLTITLNDVVQAGPAGWTANVTESPAPVYTPTIQSLGAIKLTANDQNFVFGTDGTLTFPNNITIGTSSGNFAVTADNYITLETLGPAQIEIGRYSPSGSLVIVGSTNTQFHVDSTLIRYAGDIIQSAQDNTQCLPNVDTVVYTATDTNQHSIKLFVMAEGLTDGGGTSWDTQACDVIAVKGFNNNIVHVTTYGVTYSGATAIAEFDGQWNVTTNRIEITCRPTSVTNDVRVSVHAIEMTTND